MVFLMGCKKNRISASFLIENYSGVPIDSFHILPNASIEYVSIGFGQRISYITDMSEAVGDGAYQVSYVDRTNGLTYIDTFGYYSNGRPLESQITYQIEPPSETNTIRVDDEAVSALKVQLRELANWEYSDNTNIREMVKTTGHELVLLLQKGPLPLMEDLGNFSKITSADEIINVYNFSYYSGGTAGTIQNPVIQWIKSDDTYGSYELFPAGQRGFYGLETDFTEIYKLPASDRDVYLLIGQAKASSNAYTGHALVAQIKNDHIILDYPAFFNSGSVLAFYDDVGSGADDSNCIACITYDERAAVLSIDGLGSRDKIGILTSGAETKKTISGRPKVRFHFDGKRFQFMKS